MFWTRSWEDQIESECTEYVGDRQQQYLAWDIRKDSKLTQEQVFKNKWDYAVGRRGKRQVGTKAQGLEVQGVWSK